MRKIIQLLAVINMFCCSPEKVDEWQLIDFEKQDDVNPIMTPDTSSLFRDPITQRLVKWEGKDVFNPASLVKDDTLFMLYRAEDFVGKYNGTSRIGLAYSFDGLNFTRLPQPVFYPDEDEYKGVEWEGGSEDPRIVKREDGLYVMTYTAYDGNLARLLVATTYDLRSWKKHGSVFQDSVDINQWSKSGSIVSRSIDDELIAEKIDQKYWMYFGDTDLFIAQSNDLIRWDPVKTETGEWLKVLSPRAGKFDSDLVEPGPSAITTSNGILLIYNSRNRLADGDQTLPDGTYSAGQALFDPTDPTKLIRRSEDYFFTPDKPYEITGQVNNVCFVEGLCHYKNQWFLYYGTADSKIAVAVSPQELN